MVNLLVDGFMIVPFCVWIRGFMIVPFCFIDKVFLKFNILTNIECIFNNLIYIFDYDFM